VSPIFRNYDVVASIYPMLERAAFGRQLDDARKAFLDSLVSRNRLLLIGEGNGRFLGTCLQNKIGGSITVVDLSAKMLSLLRSRVSDMEKNTALELVQADFRHWQITGQPFDGIVTHFFLDLFKPDSQRSIIQKIAALSYPETIWVNVDFKTRLGSRLHRCIDWLQYRFDRLVSGIEADRHYDPKQWITAAGWIPRQERAFRKNSVVAELFVRKRN
jgi:ubiquinone/menaquinone biosynthesis C-methylase UbiE